ncbi:MAG TPA: hypothetical protein DC047_19915 [Blastocatellia bacterium]|nr:hypothetical protein [Blastocatellia bacterium]
MSIVRLVIAATLFTLGCVAPAAGKPWRGIVPLRSTRANVEALLGTPQTGTRNVYKTETETVTVAYAETPCTYGWQVPIDTVISLLVSPKNPLKLADVKLDESKYEKRKDNHLENVYYYVNQNEGINWTVDTGQGIATTFEYYPSDKDAPLKCSLKNGVVALTPKSSPPAVTRPTKKKRARARKQQATYSCPMDPDVVSSEPGFCHRCGMRLRRVATVAPQPATTTSAKPWPQLSTRDRLLAMEQLAPSDEYTCLMHPDVHESQSGLCPKCGMPLVKVEPSVRGEYKFLLTSEPERPRAGEPVRLHFTISNPESGERVKDFVITHEKLIHLFIVSQDLSEYQHIHPQLEADGTFSVATTLPRAGLYKLHADFFPMGGLPQLIHRELVTAGYTLNASSSLPALTPDARLVKTIDSMKITLEPGGPLVAGTLIPLTYRLVDSITGEAVRDLEPYLGAWGHTLILNADQSEYLHTHPSEMLPSGGHAGLRGGPNVDFKAMFPAAGEYRIWTQFQRAGKVSTVFFTVRVKAEKQL